MCRPVSSPAGTRPACFAHLIPGSARIIEISESQSAPDDVRPVQAHAALGTDPWSGPVRAARGRAAGRAPRTGLGVHSLRPPGARFLRGMDLTAAATSQLDRLRQVLDRRGRGGTDTAAPPGWGGGVVPLGMRAHGLGGAFTPPAGTGLTHKGQISIP